MNELAITGNARRRICALCEELKAKIGQSAIPAIMWIDRELNPDIPESGVTIGFYNEDQRAALGAAPATVDGFEYVLAVGQEDERRFIGKTLDYRDGRFCLD